MQGVSGSSPLVSTKTKGTRSGAFLFLAGTVSNHLALLSLFAPLRFNLAFVLGSRANMVRIPSKADESLLSRGVRRYIDACRQNPLVSTKKSSFCGTGIFYPSRGVGISSPHEMRCIQPRAASRPCISSRFSVYFPAA